LTKQAKTGLHQKARFGVLFLWATVGSNRLMLAKPDELTSQYDQKSDNQNMS
jgi:hypothetical protein